MSRTHCCTLSLLSFRISAPDKFKKSHTCEGGAHLRISFWHLLMNLKNKYLCRPKKIKNNFTIYNVAFFKKK